MYASSGIIGVAADVPAGSEAEANGIWIVFRGGPEANGLSGWRGRSFRGGCGRCPARRRVGSIIRPWALQRRE
jgi:hypothetical protein